LASEIWILKHEILTALLSEGNVIPTDELWTQKVDIRYDWTESSSSSSSSSSNNNSNSSSSCL
jgi:hypothetical protein